MWDLTFDTKSSISKELSVFTQKLIDGNHIMLGSRAYSQAWHSKLIFFTNIDMSNFVIFRPIQRKLSKQVVVHVCINNQMLTKETSIRYLVVYIDYNISWKNHITNNCLGVMPIGQLCNLYLYYRRKSLE